MKIENRPWGEFKQFTLNEISTVKILTINPNEELSLQSHKKRKELWYFFDEAIVQLGNTLHNMRPGNTIEIKKEIPHRIISKGNKVRVLEISYGTFDENDEIRLEDKYGRL